jgi:beta-lactamase class A
MTIPHTTRRSVLAGAACAGFGALLPGRALAAPDNPAADQALRSIEQAIGGRLGVFAFDTGNGRSLGWRADERFAMCSTFKLLLAAAVLHRVDARQAALDQRLRVTPADLVNHSPVTAPRVEQGFITVAEACEATVTVSDNAAANLLLPLVGGPKGLTGWLRRHAHDRVTRLDRNEPALNTNLEGDPRDTTTPRAMARTTGRLFDAGSPLAEPSREQLRRWIEAASTGYRRLRAGLPAEWRVGDKTGTGERGAVNDVAVAWPGGRPPLVLAVYLRGSSRPMAELEAAHAEVARHVAAALG